MENVNAYYRENGTLVGCPSLNESLAMRMAKAMKRAHAGYDVPFPQWMLDQERAKITS